jgi:hypothetical protein
VSDWRTDRNGVAEWVGDGLGETAAPTPDRTAGLRADEFVPVTRSLAVTGHDDLWEDEMHPYFTQELARSRRHDPVCRAASGQLTRSERVRTQSSSPRGISATGVFDMWRLLSRPRRNRRRVTTFGAYSDSY